MRAFFLAYREILQIASGELVSTLGSAKVQTASGFLAAQDGMAAVAAQFPLPWSHYVRLLAVRNPEARRCGLVPKFLGLMLELGGDFTFVGRQRRRHLVPNRPDVFFRPRCLVVIDLKLDRFTHSDAARCTSTSITRGNTGRSTGRIRP